MRGWVKHTGNHTGAEVQVFEWTHRQMCAEWTLVVGIGAQSHCSRMQTVENKDHWNRLGDTIRRYRLECREITWLDASWSTGGKIGSARECWSHRGKDSERAH